MRVSLAACLAGALGMLGGGWLVGQWCLGLMLILVSAGAVAYGLLRDDARGGAPEVQELTVADILRKAERAG